MDSRSSCEKQRIMANESMSDMEKLYRVFNIEREFLKRNCPEIYYAILGVLDGKIGDMSISYFN